MRRRVHFTSTPSSLHLVRISRKTNLISILVSDLLFVTWSSRSCRCYSTGNETRVNVVAYEWRYVVRDFLGTLGRFDWNEWGCVGDEGGPRQVTPISPLPKNPRRGVVGKCLRKIADSTPDRPWTWVPRATQAIMKPILFVFWPGDATTCFSFNCFE